MNEEGVRIGAISDLELRWFRQKKYKPRLVETIEQAIDVVLHEKTECQLEWYSLGKTREEFLEYLDRNGIDPQKLGIFISGRFEPPWIGKLTFMPLDWVEK